MQPKNYTLALWQTAHCCVCIETGDTMSSYTIFECVCDYVGGLFTSTWWHYASSHSFATDICRQVAAQFLELWQGYGWTKEDHIHTFTCLSKFLQTKLNNDLAGGMFFWWKFRLRDRTKAISAKWVPGCWRSAHVTRQARLRARQSHSYTKCCFWRVFCVNRRFLYY